MRLNELTIGHVYHVVIQSYYAEGDFTAAFKGVGADDKGYATALWENGVTLGASGFIHKDGSDGMDHGWWVEEP